MIKGGAAYWEKYLRTSCTKQETNERFFICHPTFSAGFPLCFDIFMGLAGLAGVEDWALF